jgi:hypothetical protein
MNATTTTISFADIGSSLEKISKAEEGFYPKLASYVHQLVTAGKDAEGIKATLKEDEKAYEKAKGFKASSVGAYRSAKSVILKAVENGVSLVDDKGKALGKSALEKAIAECGDEDAKASKTPEEKCMIALATFRSCYSSIDSPDAVKRLAIELANLLKEVSSDLPKGK